MQNDEIPFWFGQGRPSASPEELDETERHIGHRLPAEYRTLLLIQNGGVSNFTAFKDGDWYLPLMPIFGAGQSAHDSLVRAHDIAPLEGRPPGVVLFAAEGHSWLGLDYRKPSAEPEVVLGNTDEAEVKPVAPTFAAFLKGLVEEMPL